MLENEKWSDYWQNESATGEVFVNDRGEKHVAIKAFWRDQVDSLSANHSLIDLACGAGSIFADIANAEELHLYAADLSAVALAQLSKRMPNVQTQVCSADELPFDTDSFDMVVSQFGIEYAGAIAFEEAVRIVKPGGKVTVLCHIRDGFIDSKNKQELIGAQLVRSLNFIQCAKDVTEAMFTGQESSIKSTLDQFVAVEPTLAKYVAESPSGPHVHLYNGFKQLFVNRQAYNKKDIIQWLESMDEEVETAIIRLTSMRNAAQSLEDMQNIQQGLLKRFASMATFEPFLLPGHTLPVAWRFELVKN